MMKKILAVLFLFSLGLLVTGCAGGGGNDGGQVRVTVSPTTANVIAGQTQQFTASVTGALNSAVAWTVSCSTSSCGTIDSSGLYSAPALIPSDTTVTVTATSQEDTNIVGTASVTQSAVTVAVSPNTSLTLISADTRQFTATVDDAPTGHTTATWSVNGSGTIDANGLYSAPAKVAADATVTVTATSDFDNTKKTSVTISLKAPVVTLSPGDMTLEAGAQQQFTPTVSYVPAGQNGVTWDLNGLGSISSGLYHAPMLVGTHQGAIIKAVSVFDDTKSAQSVVTMDPVVIGVTPDTVTLYPEQTHQFTATVANHVNKTSTWSVTGTSCGGGACGTVDGNGLYTAPSSIESEFTINVVATSVADNSKTDTAVVTLKPITVTVSPKTASVNLNGTRQFSATVQGGSNLNVTWSVSGTGCSGNTCGTIDSTTGLYTAPGSIPVPPTVTVKATAVADPTRTDTATVTIISNPNLKLNGMYAFTFTGWDASEKALDAIGSMTADGNGHISGRIDINGVTTAYRRINEVFSGTYHVNSADNRGEMVFNLSTGAMTFRFAVSTTGDKGNFILFESSGKYGSGFFKRQTSSDFSLNNLAGDCALGMSGMSALGDERNAVAGRAHLDSSGTFSNTFIDIASTGAPRAYLSFTGTAVMNSGTGMASGRGTMAVTTTEGTTDISFYMVNANESFIMVSDTIGSNVPLLIGRMLRQTSFGFNGKSVFYMTGIVNQTVKKSGVTIGQFNAGTAGSGTGTAYYTSNGGGSVFSGSTELALDGITVLGRQQWSSAVLGSYVMYLVAPNTGFILQVSDPGSTVNFGFFEPQSAGPFANSMLSGEYSVVSLEPAVSRVPLGHGIQTWNGLGAWTGTGSVTDPNSGMYPDVSSAGTYILTDGSIGTGNWQGSSGADNKKFFLISPDKMIMVSTDTSDLFPSVEILEK